MTRRQFPYPDDDVRIVMNDRDGTLTIEAEADYGDSQSGWGGTTKTITLSGKQLDEFRKFLGS